MQQLIATALAAGIVFSITAPADEPRVSTGTLCVAHRGNSSEHLENSMAALRSAIELGTPVVEFDIRHTRDGQAVVMHDARLWRTARSKPGRRCRQLLPIRKLSLAHVRESCMLNNGEEIPTLREALDELGRSETGIFLEFKDMPNLSTLRIVDEYYRSKPERLRVISFKEKILDYVRANLPAPLLFGGSALFHVSVTERGAGTAYDGVTVHSPSAEFIRRYQAMGIEVGAWTVDSSRQMSRYFETGADYITTNRPRDCLAIDP